MAFKVKATVPIAVPPGVATTFISTPFPKRRSIEEDVNVAPEDVLPPAESIILSSAEDMAPVVPTWMSEPSTVS